MHHRYWTYRHYYIFGSIEWICTQFWIKKTFLSLISSKINFFLFYLTEKFTLLLIISKNNHHYYFGHMHWLHKKNIPPPSKKACGRNQNKSRTTRFIRKQTNTNWQRIWSRGRSVHNYYNNKYRTVEACEEARSITSGGRPRKPQWLLLQGQPRKRGSVVVSSASVCHEDCWFSVPPK